MSLAETPQPEDDPHYHSSEETPLLLGAAAALGAENEEDPCETYRWPVFVSTFILIFMLELSIGISTPAWNALLEKGLCAEAHPELAHFLVAGDDNPMCKDPAVQGRLAMYRGWAYTLECAPTIFLAVPYGTLSDSWGRKPVAIMSFVGLGLMTLWYEVVFYFPLPMWTYLWSFVWEIIGGGSPVGAGMLYTMLADIVPAEKLSSVLFRFYAVAVAGLLVSNALGGFLLSKGPWVSLITGNLIMLLSLLVIYFLPETLIVRQWHDGKAGKTVGSSSTLAPEELEDGGALKKNGLRGSVDAAWERLVNVWDFLISNKRIVMLMIPLIFSNLGKYVEELLLQYSTKRYGWSWSKASYFLTLKSASYIIVLTVLLPAISTFCLSTLHMAPLSKDLWLARWSSFILILADLLVALSYTPSLYALGLVLLAGGCGLPPLLRSLLNAMVEPHHVGILNTLLGFLDTLGLMIAAPIFSQALKKGIEMGGGWVGLPFVAGTGICVVATVIIWLYRIPVQPLGDRGGE